MLFSTQALKPTCQASASAQGGTSADGLGCGHGAEKGGGIRHHAPNTLLSVSLGPQVSLHPPLTQTPWGTAGAAARVAAQEVCVLTPANHGGDAWGQ